MGRRITIPSHKKKRETMKETVFDYIEKNGPISPQELEFQHPGGMSSVSIRTGIEDLMNEGYIRLDDDLKLVVSRHMERCMFPSRQANAERICDPYPTYFYTCSICRPNIGDGRLLHKQGTTECECKDYRGGKIADIAKNNSRELTKLLGVDFYEKDGEVVCSSPEELIEILSN